MNAVQPPTNAAQPPQLPGLHALQAMGAGDASFYGPGKTYGPGQTYGPGNTAGSPVAGSYQAPPQYPGPVAAALHHRGSLFGPQPCPQPFEGGCPPVYEQIATEGRFGDPFPRPRLLPPKGFLAGASFRFEYLHFKFDEVGEQLIGAPQATRDPRDPFSISAPGAGTDPVVAFDTGGFTLDDISGVRLLLNVPTQYGDFTLGGFNFDQAENDLFEETELRSASDFFTLVTDTAPTRPAITFLNSGVPSNDLATVFSELNVELKTEFGGAKIDYALNSLTGDRTLFRLRPVIGFQYLRLREQFSVFGPFNRDIVIVDDPDTVEDETGGIIGATRPITIDRSIDARIDNHLFAPTIALRMELGNEWLQVSVEPKFALAANRRRQRLRTSNVFGNTEITEENPGSSTFAATEDNDLEPYFELNVGGRAKLTKRLSVNLGYNLFVLSGIGRPTGAIEYDALSADIPNINLRDQQDAMVLHGLYVGGEVLLGPLP